MNHGLDRYENALDAAQGYPALMNRRALYFGHALAAGAVAATTYRDYSSAFPHNARGTKRKREEKARSLNWGRGRKSFLGLERIFLR